LADKMLTLAGFLGLMMQGVASPWAIYLILTRELFITGLRVNAVAEGVDTLKNCGILIDQQEIHEGCHMQADKGKEVGDV